VNHCELRVAPRDVPDPLEDIQTDDAIAHAVFGGGCFWCVEAVFKRLKGVTEVSSGYAGGSAESANYQAVCSGQTNHAEVIEVEYQPDQISFGQLLKVFFSVAHDPTQLNGQGNDQGRQYRSAVFYIDQDQQRVARAYIDQLQATRIFSRPIVTTLEPLENFYLAEAHHQDYADRNPGQPYITHISAPKVATLRDQFADKLKDGTS
jgi:peptide-methionine (S)-S-oxide reductase